jgi:hypothetical protein
MRCGAAVLFLAGVLAAQPSRPDAKGTIRGVLKDTDGIPAIGLSVGATPAGAGLRFATAPDGMRVNIGIRPMSADTGEDGSYALTGLDPGTYAIGVARERTNGIGAERERITIASRQVRLDPGQDMTLDFVIPASPAIGGHVRNEKDEPVIDAFVWLVKPQYQAGVLRQAVIGPKVTGEDGAYEFADTLEPNRGYYVLVDWRPRRLRISKTANPSRSPRIIRPRPAWTRRLRWSSSPASAANRSISRSRRPPSTA